MNTQGDKNFKKRKLDKFDKLSGVESKHSTESRVLKNFDKKMKQAAKLLMKKGDRKGMEAGDTLLVNWMGNGTKVTKKRKRSENIHGGNPFKQKKLNCDGQTVSISPSAEQLKAGQGSKLTRKQRRNRKKNNSKNNKYKHLALSQSNNNLGKDSVGLSSNTCPKDSDCKQSSTGVSVSQSASNKFETEQKMPTVRKLSQSQESVKELVELPKTKKKSVKKGQKQKTLKNCVSRKIETLHSSESDDDDYDDGNNDDWTQDMPDSDNESISGAHNDKVSGTCSKKSTETAATIVETKHSTKKTKSFSVLDKAHEKLNAARFRFLNEQLYTSTGADAMSMFQDDPEAFHIYHQGFQQQVTQWPVNPLDTIINQLSKMSKSTTVADFGCGDARLAESLPHNVVHSFDLVSTKPCITACDIAKVPLGNSSVNVAVFCLSLMGTNLSDYLCEANRVLQKGGSLKIAEVISRFHSVSRFVQNVQVLGFHLQKKTFLGKMFMLFTFKKVADSSRKRAPRIQLKACHYKRR